MSHEESEMYLNTRTHAHTYTNFHLEFELNFGTSFAVCNHLVQGYLNENNI